MIRDNWRFEYAASDLASAAEAKMNYHQERLDFWKAKKSEVMDSIRADGLEIDEKIVMEFHNIKARDWVNGAQIVIRNDLKRDLDECLEKLRYHTEHLAGYDSWPPILAAIPKRAWKLITRTGCSSSESELGARRQLSIEKGFFMSSLCSTKHLAAFIFVFWGMALSGGCLAGDALVGTLVRAINQYNFDQLTPEQQQQVLQRQYMQQQLQNQLQMQQQLQQIQQNQEMMRQQEWTQMTLTR